MVFVETNFEKYHHQQQGTLLLFRRFAPIDLGRATIWLFGGVVTVHVVAATLVSCVVLKMSETRMLRDQRHGPPVVSRVRKPPPRGARHSGVVVEITRWR